jgi:hypothetical protein
MTGTKTTTLKRDVIHESDAAKSERDKHEEKRVRDVKRKTKAVECLSSHMNACQAIVKPDCSKAKVQKSRGMKTALLNELVKCYRKVYATDDISDEDIRKMLSKENVLIYGLKSIPSSIAQNCTAMCVESAGIKFNANAKSGRDYIASYEQGVIAKALQDFPNTKYVALCGEKYSFTPNILKGAT